MAVALAKSGCVVAAVFNGNVERATQFQKEFSQRVPDAPPLMLIQADVSSSVQCRNAVNQVVEKFGRIDILVKYVSVHVWLTLALAMLASQLIVPLQRCKTKNGTVSFK